MNLDQQTPIQVVPATGEHGPRPKYLPTYHDHPEETRERMARELGLKPLHEPRQPMRTLTGRLNIAAWTVAALLLAALAIVLCAPKVMR